MGAWSNGLGSRRLKAQAIAVPPVAESLRLDVKFRKLLLR